MAEMSPEKKSNALPNALVKDEEEGVAKAAGKLEQPEPRKYKWLAAFFMSVAFVSILANGGQAIANATKPVGTHAQKHVYAVGLTSRLNSAGGSVVAMVPCVEVSEAIASLQNGDSDQGLVMVPLPGGEFLTPSMSAAHYQVHEDSFGIEQIFLSGDDDVSYNVSCETSMAACETDPGLSCDVLPSAAVTALSFEDAFDGDFHRRLTHRLTHRRLIEAKLPPPPPPPSPSTPPTHAEVLRRRHAAVCVPRRKDFQKITCPVMGMLIKSGELVPSCDGMVDKQQTLAAMSAKGFPDKIATATTNDNFKSTKCSTCPDRIDPFEMNTINDPGVTFSPKGQPHEHFRSTGIRDMPRNQAEDRFKDAEERCVESAKPPKDRWDFEAITCMADFWDLDAGCGGARPTSNDVDRNKRPAGCCDNLAPRELCCESTAKKPQCRSQLHDTIEFLFDSFTENRKIRGGKKSTISKKDWKGMWLRSCFPGECS